MKFLTLVLLAVGLVCGACQKPVTRLNAPPHGTTESPSQMQSMYVQMLDNALLEDMTVSDVHFVPHRAMLSTLGEERVARLAALMEIYGGTIHFASRLTDEKLLDARTEKIREFLCNVGIDTTAQVLVRDLRAGEGMDAYQAILIKANEATYKPKKDSGASSSSGGAKTGTESSAGGGGSLFHDVNQND